VRDGFVGGACRRVQAPAARPGRAALAIAIVARRDHALGALQVVADALALLGTSSRRDVRSRSHELIPLGLIGAELRFGFAPALVRADETLVRYGSGSTCFADAACSPRSTSCPHDLPLRET